MQCFDLQRYTFSLDKKNLKKVQKQNKKNNYKVCNNFLIIDQHIFKYQSEHYSQHIARIFPIKYIWAKYMYPAELKSYKNQQKAKKQFQKFVKR